jgi:hypothetical protein
MIPPGKTTLYRMQMTALDEQQRIEISQDGRVRCGMQKEPLPEQIIKRDDFAGIVRLLDTIMSDKVILDRLEERAKAAKAAAPAPIATGDEEIEAAAE